MQKELTTEEIEVYAYLDTLRESGETNMLGATPYLQDEFGYDKKDARSWLNRWMKQF